MPTNRIMTAPPAYPSPAPKPPAPLLEIIDLAVSFETAGDQRVQAVDGLTLAVHPQQTVALVGESGCGKSVSALACLQLLPPSIAQVDRGSVLYKGRNLLTMSRREILKIRGNEITMIFQEPTTSLNPVYSVGEQITEAIRIHQKVSRREARDIAAQAMHDVGIPEPRQRLSAYPHEMSGGMQQRVMIAMALACKPRLILADEPTTSLDVTIQAQILALLRSVQRETNMGTVLISHDLGVVAQNADVACVMYAGRVLEYATVESLFADPMHPYTRGLFRSIPRLDRRRQRLTTVSELIGDHREFRRLPGYDLGLVPWWPSAPPPPNTVQASGPRSSVLYEIKPDHWVSCWRTEYIAEHPSRRPNLDHRRMRDEPAAHASAT
jgi:ABC-type dipeptide/oligopeptide/nickel transport system ATPase component